MGCDGIALFPELLEGTLHTPFAISGREGSGILFEYLLGYGFPCMIPIRIQLFYGNAGKSRSYDH